MKNKGMPGLLKIGMTTRTPAVRALELSNTTGVPHPFEVCFSIHVSDCHAVESKLHDALSSFRVNNRREFFRMTVGQARRRVKGAAAAHRLYDGLNRPATRWLGVFILCVVLYAFVHNLGGIPGIMGLVYGLVGNGHWNDMPQYSRVMYNDPTMLWHYGPILLGAGIAVALLFRPRKKERRWNNIRGKRFRR